MKVVCIGEVLIDFVCTDVNKGLNLGCNFIKKAGGAPANVSACIAQLGGHSEFVGAVGNDPFGHYLLDRLNEYQVKTDYVQQLSTPTTLAFVSLADDGEREFTFNRGADEQLTLTDNRLNSLLDDAIVHFGSATALLGGNLYDSYLASVKLAFEQGNLIVFDPNYRIDLWQNNIEQFKQRTSEFFKMSDVVKVSEEELELLTDCSNFRDGCHRLHQLGVKLVFVTMGKDGCLVSHNGEQYVVPAYEIEAIDTTGAGDSFIGAILYQMSVNSDIDALFKDQMADFVAFAQKVSSKVCTKIGAMSALPTLAEVNATRYTVRQ